MEPGLPSGFQEGATPTMMRFIARSVGELCLVLCGVAATWACACVGLALLCPNVCSRSKVEIARLRTAEVSQAITQFQIDQGRCPETQEDLVGGHYLGRRADDPWKTSLYFSCSSRSVRVNMAGPDRRFRRQNYVTTVVTLNT